MQKTSSEAQQHTTLQSPDEGPLCGLCGSGRVNYCGYADRQGQSLASFAAMSCLMQCLLALLISRASPGAAGLGSQEGQVWCWLTNGWGQVHAWLPHILGVLGLGGACWWGGKPSALIRQRGLQNDACQHQCLCNRIGSPKCLLSAFKSPGGAPLAFCLSERITKFIRWV